MMKWRTSIAWSSELEMSHRDKYLFMGSCFSDNMSSKMHEHGFETITNPFGIMYNPFSIRRSLSLLLGKEELSEKKYVERGNNTFHYDLHSAFYAENKDLLGAKVKAKRSDWLTFSKDLKTSEVGRLFVFITLGTAWVYRENSSSEYVANCHKQSGSLFEKDLLSEDQIMSELEVLLGLRPHHQTTFIFTISPVRHLKDGMVENQLSKSRLINCVQEIVHKNECAHYFPAYEIMMDDLRDYRYYSDDLLHPNNQAIEYIWSILCASYFGDETMLIMKDYSKLKKMQAHRPLFPESEEAIHFEEKIRIEVDKFLQKHPTLRF